MSRFPQGYSLLRPQPGVALVYRVGLLPLLEQSGLVRFPVVPWTGGDEPGPAAGRAAVWRADFGEGPPLVMKSYRRGGLAGRMLGDRYLGSSRWIEEILVGEAARAAGLRVPVIESFWIQKAGILSYRTISATREISGARDLFHAFTDFRDSSTGRQRLLAAVAGEVRKLHDAGIHHPDLNLGNILLAGPGSDPEIHLIDFDKAVLRDGPLGRGDRHGALIRMYRSLAKLSRPEPPPLSPEEKELFLSSYWGMETGPRTALRRRCRRELALHRLWWRLKPIRSRGPNDAGTP